MDRVRGRTNRAAFTLLEMLLVIVIIMILVAILVAGVMNRSPGKVATQNLIKQLRQSLEAYFAVYQAYPPSNYGGMAGSQCLYYFLMGPNGQGWTRNDGVAPGFTWQAPAIDSNYISDKELNKKFFWDGYGDKAKALLYFRADPTKTGKSYTQVYSSNDNANLGDYGWNPPADTWRKVVAADPNSSNSRAKNENSYILWAAGGDREFGYNGDRIDDEMNLVRPRDQ